MKSFMNTASFVAGFVGVLAIFGGIIMAAVVIVRWMFLMLAYRADIPFPLKGVVIWVILFLLGGGLTKLADKLGERAEQAK